MEDGEETLEMPDIDPDDVFRRMQKDRQRVLEQEQRDREEAILDHERNLANEIFQIDEPYDLTPDDLTELYKELDEWTDAVDKRTEEMVRQAILDADKQNAELLSATSALPEPVEIDQGEVVDVPVPKPSRIPSGIVGRSFILRKEGWEGAIWSVNPGGARSGDIQKRLSKKIIQALVDSMGFVVITDNYEVVAANDDEKRLINVWREMQPSSVPVEKIDTKDEDWQKKVEAEARESAKQEVDVDTTRFLENVILIGKSRVKNWPSFAFQTLGLMVLNALADSKIVFIDAWKEYPIGIFGLAIGDSGAKKSSGYNAVMNPVVKTDITGIVLSHDWTQEAAIKRISDMGIPSVILYRPEFLDVLDEKRGRSYMGGLKGFLTGLFEDPNYHKYRATADIDNIDLHNLSLSFFSTIQTDFFLKLVSDEDVQTGFYGRFVLMEIPTDPEPPIQSQSSEHVSLMEEKLQKMCNKIRSSVGNISRENPLRFAFSLEDDVKVTEWYARVYKKCEAFGSRDSSILKHICDRDFTLMKKCVTLLEFQDLAGTGRKLKKISSYSWKADHVVKSENVDEAIKYANQSIDTQIDYYFRIGEDSKLMKDKRKIDRALHHPKVKSWKKGSVVVALQRDVERYANVDKFLSQLDVLAGMGFYARYDADPKGKRGRPMKFLTNSLIPQKEMRDEILKFFKSNKVEMSE